MRTIGLIGGTTWRSTLDYYRYINEEVNRRLGDSHSAKCILCSIDYQELDDLRSEMGWVGVTGLLIDAGKKLENAGADCMVICANTLHKVVDDVHSVVGLPVIDIIDVTAKEVPVKGIKTVGLIGTKVTMEDDFYTKRLKEKYSIRSIIPNKKDREFIMNAIITDASTGRIKKTTKDRFKIIVKGLEKEGADGVILGCTEIPLIIGQKDIEVPVFDTTRIHSVAAVEWALRV